eukprot:TRINITY_DN9530_c0_g1_i7.p1 TRINITY_DN9530_c0_g1~~TRINITY_DN9530_c0_g1_i7.p1  ORF type:complete len:282 (+),score=62.56 TRINITY_DN9530_c0_g1_i7:61-906(+)
MVPPEAHVSQLPVVLFSHGLGGSQDIHSMQVSHLVSNGYVVAMMHHGDETANVICYPDGTVKYYRHLTPHEKATKESEIRTGQVLRRVKESRACLDALTDYHLNQSGPQPGRSHFFGRLDLERVAIMGHSFGAATALATSYEDPRFRCAIGLDSWLVPVPSQVFEHGVRQPFILVISDEFRDDVGMPKNMACHRSLMRTAGPHSLCYTLRGSRHTNFCDMPVFSEFLSRKLGRIGAESPKEILRISSMMDLAFLDKHLLSKPNTLIDQRDQCPPCIHWEAL